jgi:hypothetical protein
MADLRKFLLSVALVLVAVAGVQYIMFDVTETAWDMANELKVKPVTVEKEWPLEFKGRWVVIHFAENGTVLAQFQFRGEMLKYENDPGIYLFGHDGMTYIPGNYVLIPIDTPPEEYEHDSMGDVEDE